MMNWLKKFWCMIRCDIMAHSWRSSVFATFEFCEWCGISRKIGSDAWD